MDHICTWLCADEKGEESLFPQTGQLSSSQSHQDIYWRCVIVFFVTSKRFNSEQNHILFTNVHQLPVLDGMNVDQILEQLGVSVIKTDFKYKTPKGYYGAFQNQFYEFSILEFLSKNNNPTDQYLILDSDCVFIKPAAPLFDVARPNGFISFKDDVLPEYVINGLSRNDMKGLYERFLNAPIPDVPAYHLGEFLLCSGKNVKKIFSDFGSLWPALLNAHINGKMKFNEEAHTLSFLYYKNGFRAADENKFMKRIWTNPLFYRNVEETDLDLTIWHLPSEKSFGLKDLFDEFMQYADFALHLSDAQYIRLVRKKLGIPYLSMTMKMKYYTVSYYRAIKKRVVKAVKLKLQ